MNRKEASIRANYKLLQLKIATELGMTIPTTLCSNNTSDILRFFQHQKQGIIYKPLSYQFWEQEQGFKVLYTSKITNIEMLKSGQHQLFPGIFIILCIPTFVLIAKLTFLPLLVADNFDTPELF